jgi:hypothetical integral membrane protein (TIGR02206 family)
MEGFFGHEYSKYPFTFLSNEHLIVLLAFFFLTFVLYRLRSQIFKYDLWIRSALFITLFSLEILYHFWLVRGGNWDITYTLPFQLCSISLIISLILLMTNSRVLATVLYFIGGVGAFAALLTPELFLGFPHFRFFQFFITHMVIIWTALYFVWVRGYYPGKMSVWVAFLFLNGCSFVAFWVNRLTGGNYMFLAQKPENASLIDYLGPYPYYILSLEALALGLFWILWLPFAGKGQTVKQNG